MSLSNCSSVEFVHYIDATEESKKLSPNLFYEKETREFYEYLRNERMKLLNIDKLTSLLQCASETFGTFSVVNGSLNVVAHQRRKYQSFSRRLRNLSIAEAWIKNRQAIRDFDRRVIPFAFAFARERQREATIQARKSKRGPLSLSEPRNVSTALPEYTSSTPQPVMDLMKNPAAFQSWLEVIRGPGESVQPEKNVSFEDDVVVPETRTILKRGKGTTATPRKRAREEESLEISVPEENATGTLSSETASSEPPEVAVVKSDNAASKKVWHEMQIEIPSLGTNQHCIYVNSNDLCDICHETMEMATELPVMVCPKCQSTRTCYQGNKTLQNSQCSKYVRKVHFRLYLTRFQWRETMVVPIDVIWHVSNFLAQCGFTSKNTTVADVRWALQELRLSKYYNNITQVYCRVCNQSPPCLSPDETTKFFQMFDEIQDIYYQLHHQSRTNFLSYQYVMYKLCELQGLYVYLPFFKMLKGDTNLLAHDDIWKEICDILDWTFIETSPTVYTVHENVKTYLDTI